MDEPQAKLIGDRKAPRKRRTRKKKLSLREAPPRWPADVRAEFDAATPMFREFMLERSNGLATATIKRDQAVALERKAFEEYRDRLRPYADRLAEIRGDPVEIDPLVERLLEFEIAVEAAPPELRPAVVVKHAVAAYGLPAGAFIDPILATRQSDPTDTPADVMARREAVGQAQVAQQEQQRVEAQTQTEAAVLAFATATDASGQPKHPYFDEVQDEMRDLAAVVVSKGLQPSLDALYSAGCRLSPDVSAKIAETERRQDAAQRDVDERERVAKAKAANGSITGGGGGSADPVGGTTREILEREVPGGGW